MKDCRTGRQILDSQGQPKARPAVVLSSDDDISSGRDIDVAAVSTKYDPSNCPSHWHPLDCSIGGHPLTGLDQPCVVKSDWTERIDPNDIVVNHPNHTGKRVPSRIVKQVLMWLRDHGRQQ